MVSGLVLQEKRSHVELAHGPVLDDNFPQDGTIAIYICCVWAGGTFLQCCRKVPQAHSFSACVLQELG
jgi:hypothetical protein